MDVGWVHAVDCGIHLDRGTELLELLLGVGARLLGEHRQDSRTGLHEGDVGRIGDAREFTAHRALKLGYGASHLDTGGPAAHDDDAQVLLGLMAVVDLLVGREQAVSDLTRLPDRLHLERMLGHPRHAEGGADAAGRDDEVIPGHHGAVIEAKCLGGEVHPDDLAAAEVDTRDRPADRVGDVLVRQSPGCNLVEQRGEEVIRISINEGDVDAAHLREFACAAQAAKTSSDDDHPMLRHFWSLVRFTGTAGCLNLAPDPAPLPKNAIVTQLKESSLTSHRVVEMAPSSRSTIGHYPDKDSHSSSRAAFFALSSWSSLFMRASAS